MDVVSAHSDNRGDTIAAMAMLRAGVTMSPNQS
jgi:hypothetical protein